MQYGLKISIQKNTVPIIFIYLVYRSLPCKPKCAQGNPWHFFLSAQLQEHLYQLCHKRKPVKTRWELFWCCCSWQLNRIRAATLGRCAFRSTNVASANTLRNQWERSNTSTGFRQQIIQAGWTFCSLWSLASWLTQQSHNGCWSCSPGPFGTWVQDFLRTRSKCMGMGEGRGQNIFLQPWWL